MKKWLQFLTIAGAALIFSTIIDPVYAQKIPKSVTDTLEMRRTQQKNTPGKKSLSQKRPIRDTTILISLTREKIKSWNEDLRKSFIDTALTDSILKEMITEKVLEDWPVIFDQMSMRIAGRLRNFNIYLPKDSVAYQALVMIGTFQGPDSLSIAELQKYQSYGVLQKYYVELEKYILFKEGSEKFDRNLEHNLELIANQSEYISRKEFSEYRFTETSRQILKGINIYHDNDFFCPFINRDMNYTGGLRMELTTDLFKIRLLGNSFLRVSIYNFFQKIPVLNFFSKEIRRLKYDNISYQSIFYGIEAYTPYLRFDSIGTAVRMNGSPYALLAKLTREQSYLNDRPFAGIAYAGRAKYRINQIGTVRTRGEFSVGILGGSIGKEFQSLLHRDLTVDSPQPIGWDNQIANGGRMTISMQQTMEIMLLSKQNDVFKHKEMKNLEGYKGRSKLKDWINLYGSLDARLGQQITYGGFGLGFSNLNFIERSGTQMIKNRPGRHYNFIFYAEARYRRIVHNSMLEGFGWFNTREFDNDGHSDESLSKWKLERNVVNRNMLFGDIFFGFRTVKSMVFLSCTLNSREFRAEKINGVPRDLQPQLFNTQKIYAVGRLGFNFIM